MYRLLYVLFGLAALASAEGVRGGSRLAQRLRNCPAASGLAAGVTGWDWATSETALANGALPKTVSERVLSVDRAAGAFLVRTTTRVQHQGYHYHGVRTSRRACTPDGLVEFSHEMRFKEPGSSGGRGGTWVNTWTIPVLHLGPTLAPGTYWTTSQLGQARRTNADGRTTAEPVDISTEWHIAGRETVTTPAGSWLAWVAERSDGRRHRWYVDGIGMVQDDESWLVAIR